MWYMSHSKAELNKPLQFWNETLLILTFLTVRNINVPTGTVVIIYLAVFLALVIAGKILVKIGVVRFNTRLGNTQNPELLEILKRVKSIEDSLNELKGQKYNKSTNIFNYQ